MLLKKCIYSTGKKCRMIFSMAKNPQKTRFYVVFLLNVTKVEANTGQSGHLQHGLNYSSRTSIGVVTLVVTNFLNAIRHGICKVFADILINIFAPNLINGPL